MKGTIAACQGGDDSNRPRPSEREQTSEAVGRKSCISANSDSVWFYENQFASQIGSFLTCKKIEETGHNIRDEFGAILDL